MEANLAESGNGFPKLGGFGDRPGMQTRIIEFVQVDSELRSKKLDKLCEPGA
jgi:hypothetical protein